MGDCPSSLTSRDTEWFRLPNAPWSPRAGHGVAWLPGDIIFVLGGDTAEGASRHVWMSDNLAHSWSQLPDPPWLPRTEHSIAAIGGAIFVSGGYPSTGWHECLTDAWVSDDRGASWRELATPWKSGHAIASKLVATSDGSLLCIIVPASDDSSGDIWCSKDRGVSWLFVDVVPWIHKRQNHAVIPFSDGEVLVLAGRHAQLGSDFPDADVPQSWLWTHGWFGMRWQQLPACNFKGRQGFGYTVLPDGTVLVAGGDGLLNQKHGDVWSSADRGRTWSWNGHAEWEERSRPGVIVLPNGTVLSMGGSSACVEFLQDVWLLRERPMTMYISLTQDETGSRAVTCQGAHGEEIVNLKCCPEIRTISHLDELLCKTVAMPFRGIMSSTGQNLRQMDGAILLNSLESQPGGARWSTRPRELELPLLGQ